MKILANFIFFVCFLSALLVFTYSILMATRCVWASFSLHNSVLLAVLRAPLAFFDTTPMGRILNRFSRDIDTVDNALPELLESWLTSAFNVLATVVILCYATPIFIVVAIPLAVLYYLAQVRVIYHNVFLVHFFFFVSIDGGDKNRSNDKSDVIL